MDPLLRVLFYSSAGVGAYLISRNIYSSNRMAMADATFWSEVVAWLREDADLDWVNENEVNQLNIDDVMGGNWQAAMQYQGFDVKMLLKAIKRARDAYAEPEESWTCNLGGGRQVTFRNDWGVFKDLACLLMLFSYRGSTWEKVRTKSLPAVQSWMDAMRTKYNIDIRKRESGASLAPDIITLPRMAACFPAEVATHFHKGFGRPLYSVTDLHLPEATSKAVLTSAVVALLPPDWVTAANGIHLVFFCGSVLADDILHATNHKTTLSSMFTYYSASYKSPACPVAHRIKAMKRFGLCNNAATAFSANLIAAINDCELKVREKRPADPSLENVITQLKALA
uniref:Nucleocapsid protein n=1 Tax=Bunyavirus sp. TaxID=1907588 RepID=A0A2Z2D7V9_9VIRU|nr:nucleocapsid protein [Bunyavirus sp.]